MPTILRHENPWSITAAEPKARPGAAISALLSGIMELGHEEDLRFFIITS